MPRFHAEGGPMFYFQARDLGFSATVFSPTHGYLDVFPRAASTLAQLCALKVGTLVLNLAALLLKLVPVAYLMSDRAAGIVPSFVRRFAAVLLYLLLPNSGETHGNVTNAQGCLSPVVCLILFCPPWRSRRRLD